MQRETLPTLVNELAALSEPVVLALDDYHLVDALHIRERMTFLIEHLPSTCETHTVLALVHAQRADYHRALEAGDRACELVRRGGVPGDRANALITAASLRADVGDHEQARALLREAREVLEAAPGAGAMVVERLERAERRGAVRRSAPRPPPERPQLSERELAACVSLPPSPLSQREIGSELYVSLDTVKTHARIIFPKLGVPSRDGAVARARELGVLS
jgi:LuxR family maltose regulon positive regulatory protein